MKTYGVTYYPQGQAAVNLTVQAADARLDSDCLILLDTSEEIVMIISLSLNPVMNEVTS